MVANPCLLPASPTQAVEKEAALEQKFKFAGYYARFMFPKTIREVEALIKDGVEVLDRNMDSMRGALMRQGNSGAVNALIAFLENNGPTPANAATLPRDVPAAPDREALEPNEDEFVRPRHTPNVFVSSHAARAFLASMPKSIEKLRTVASATGNRVIEGYVLEIHSFAR